MDTDTKAPPVQPPFTGPDLCRKEAHEIVALLRAGEVSPQELLTAAQARTEAVEPSINAMPTVCWTRAEAAAGTMAQDCADHPGWLAGLPISIKDLTPVAGVRTTFGTRGLADFIPAASDPLVERLEARGGLVVGKSNTPEFGAGANTFNDVFGPTLNPWDTALNAGGSSGGAAASLATGEVWLAHGSDHGGSLRTPAAYCGVVGLRPSPGRAGGASPDAGFMLESAQGPMARSVMDCALFLDAMSGFEPRFAISYPAPERPFQEAARRASSNLRIAFTPDLNGFGPVDTEMVQHLRAVMEQLQGNGANVDEECPDLTGLERTYHTLRGLNYALLAKRLDPKVRQHLKPVLEENMQSGAALTLDDIADAHLTRSALFNRMVALFERFDVLALPTVGCMPRPQSEEWVREIGGQTLTGYVDWLRFAFLATTTGLPAISVPVGLGPRGMPVGLQLIGKPRGEAALLSAARFVEQVTGGPLGPIDPVTAGGL
ncbi:amidase [Pelagivirga sediminicola]|uniref:Amidase n=1 Tax=Pelagivirga sediminicola TaxID=2170575 RepID=A0A2T7G408_9RHOB|nr:amidase family protein [Pelagivirga sediminicola]PVA09138.1 amidase [Pelagivirga sediminicola]